MGFLRDGDQLRLELDWGCEPWEGRTPRSLTSARKALFLRPEPHRHEVFFDPEQLELWPLDRATQREEPPPFFRAGASLLLEP